MILWISPIAGAQSGQIVLQIGHMAPLTGLSPWNAILVEARAMTGFTLSHFIIFVELVPMNGTFDPLPPVRIRLVTGIARRRLGIRAAPQVGVAEVTGTLRARFASQVDLAVFRIEGGIEIGLAIRVPI